MVESSSESDARIVQDKDLIDEDDHLSLHFLFLLHAVLILLIVIPSLCSTLGGISWRKDKRDYNLIK